VNTVWYYVARSFPYSGEASREQLHTDIVYLLVVENDVRQPEFVARQS